MILSLMKWIKYSSIWKQCLVVPRRSTLSSREKCDRSSTWAFWKPGGITQSSSWMATPFTRPNALWFFLWGYVKSRVFSSPCPNIMALRQKILDEFILLQNNRDLITRAVRAMGSRAQLCIERNGGHVEGRFGWSAMYVFL